MVRKKCARWQQLLQPAEMDISPKMSPLTTVGNDKGRLYNKCCTAIWIQHTWSLTIGQASNQGHFLCLFIASVSKRFILFFERKIFSCGKNFQNVRGRNDYHINLFAHFLNVKSSLPTAKYHYCEEEGMQDGWDYFLTTVKIWASAWSELALRCHLVYLVFCFICFIEYENW